MPVKGLPSTLENVINSCIDDKELYSWKVIGGENKIIVSLCFRNNASDCTDAESFNVSTKELKNWITNGNEQESKHVGSESESEADNLNLMHSEFIEKSKIGNQSKPDRKGSCSESINPLLHEDSPSKNLIAETPSHDDQDDIVEVIKKESIQNISSKRKDSCSSKDNPSIRIIVDQHSRSQFGSEESLYSFESSESPKRIIATSTDSLKTLDDLAVVEKKKTSTLSKFRTTLRNSRLSISRHSTDGPLLDPALMSRNNSDPGSISPSKENIHLLSKVVKTLKRGAAHCNECNKVLKQNSKQKCTVCDVFICSDCNHQNRHNPEHKRYLSLFSFPSENTDEFCKACGYITRIRHAYNTTFFCDLCPEYQLCQGCRSQGMHGHHEEHLKPVL